MNTANIILMVILASIISFIVGNSCGQEAQKRKMSNLFKELKNFSENLKRLGDEIKKKGE